MEVSAYKTIVLELSKHDAWMLEQILMEYKNQPSRFDTDEKENPYKEFVKKLLTPLTKENAKN